MAENLSARHRQVAMEPRFGTILQVEQQLRWNADYSVEFAVTESQAQEVVRNAVEFIEAVKRLLGKQESR